MNLRTQKHSLQKHIKQRNHELYTMESEYLTNLWFIKITPCQKLRFTTFLLQETKDNHSVLLSHTRIN